MKKLTCLDYSILGLLQRKQLSGYEIRKIFETTNLGNLSSSPGAIYPALRKLKNLELIYPTLALKFLTGPTKKKFQINPNGTKKLEEWLNKPIEGINVSKNLQELLLRLAFIDTLMKKDRIIRFIKTFINEIEKYLKASEFNYKLVSEGIPTVLGILYVDYSLNMYKSQLSWAKKEIKKIAELDDLLRPKS